MERVEGRLKAIEQAVSDDGGQTAAQVGARPREPLPDPIKKGEEI